MPTFDSGNFDSITFDALILEPRYGRPIADVADGTWLPSTPAAELYTMVDEAVVDEADYIYTESAGSIAKMQLTALGDPGATQHVLKVHLSSITSETLRLKIVQAPSTVIASWDQALTPTPTTYYFTLTAPQIASITDYTALQIWLEGL